MTTTSDLVMPKLGLTMTEGRIAEWKVRPGQSFSRGDIIVVVETDKIANDVEAPSHGRLMEVLAEAGAVAPVGAPIARWEIAGAGERAATASTGPQRDASPAEDRPLAKAAAPRAGDRVVATPYARRLAREGAVRIDAIPGSGPGGRIRGVDVVKVLAERLAQSAETAVPAMRQSLPSEATPATVPLGVTRANVSVALIVRDATELQSTIERLSSGKSRFTVRDVVAYATVRAIADDSGRPVHLGLERGESGIVTLAMSAGRGLGAMARSIDQDEPAAADAEGDILLLAAAHGIDVFSPALVAPWPMVLGFATRADRGRTELTLSLAYDQDRIGHGQAQRFLSVIGELLEDPLVLLAG